jgi:hypothetical protein
MAGEYNATGVAVKKARKIRILKTSAKKRRATAQCLRYSPAQFSSEDAPP